MIKKIWNEKKQVPYEQLHKQTKQPDEKILKHLYGEVNEAMIAIN